MLAGICTKATWLLFISSPKDTVLLTFSIPKFKSHVVWYLKLQTCKLSTLASKRHLRYRVTCLFQFINYCLCISIYPIFTGFLRKIKLGYFWTALTNVFFSIFRFLFVCLLFFFFCFVFRWFLEEWQKEFLILHVFLNSSVDKIPYNKGRECRTSRGAPLTYLSFAGMWSTLELYNPIGIRDLGLCVSVWVPSLL